mmetsp:Transcript_65550/g.129838  ORF Transcript_65550/g.129838 Transcript_65550/m.129838 type:complete len:237 (+) Transcript_65550:153-863(+)
MRSRDARAAPRSRCVPALAHQSARLELCALIDPKITTSSHPGGTQCPSLTATQLRSALSYGDHHASHVRALLASHTRLQPRDKLHTRKGYRRVRRRPHRATSRACEMHSGLLPTACSLRDQRKGAAKAELAMQARQRMAVLVPSATGLVLVVAVNVSAELLNMLAPSKTIEKTCPRRRTNCTRKLSHTALKLESLSLIRIPATRHSCQEPASAVSPPTSGRRPIPDRPLDARRRRG